MTSPTPSDPEVVNESISVLVVDDEFSLRESCASLLTTDDYQVTTVGRGDEALDLIRRKRFDILLVDLFMTQASGMEILEVATSVSPDSVVILMTGNPSVETSIEGLRAGAWDYLPKPFSAGQLQILVGRAAHAVAVASRRADEIPNTGLRSATSRRQARCRFL